MSIYTNHPNRYDIDAWLGDAVHEMSDDALNRFTSAWDQINRAWPDDDDQSERDAALSAAIRYLLREADVWDIGQELMRARAKVLDATAAARMVATLASEDGVSEVELAHDLGVDRARTIRRWLGKA